MLKCYGLSLTLFLFDLGKSCSFRRQMLDQNHHSEHRCCDPGLNFTGFWWGRKGKATPQPAQPLQEDAQSVAAFPKRSCTAYVVPLSNFAEQTHLSSDFPSNTYSMRFWAWWKWPQIYQATWVPPCTFAFLK